MAVTEQKTNLTSLLNTEAKLDQKISTYIVDTLGCVCIADFANMFTQADYENKVDTDILAKTDLANNALQRGRLRTAWRLADAQFAAAAVRVRNAEPGDDEDLDKPLGKEVHDAQLEAAKKVHVPVFPPVLTPSDALFGRCYREFRKRVISVYPLSKVKSLEYQGTVMAKPRKAQLAPGVLMSISPDADPPGQDFQSVLEVLVALQILIHAWALTGTETTTSAADEKLTGLDGDFSEGLAYYAFTLDKAMTHPGPPSETVAWILDRDRQTRTKARTLIADGCPWARALRASWETHLSVLWTVGGVGISQNIPMTITDRAVAEEARQSLAFEQHDRKVTKPSAPAHCCPDFNSAHGCGRQKFCPHNLWHVCNVVTQEGAICGDPRHSAVTHYATMQSKREKSSNVSKGKGKAYDRSGQQKHQSTSSHQSQAKRQR